MQQKSIAEKLDSKYAAKPDLFYPFITSIRFPKYKALQKDFTLALNWPVVAIVGPNGSNKSSILHALASAPEGRSLADYWFSTRVDDIDEKRPVGDQHRFIYKYEFSKNSIPAECRKYRGSKKYRGSEVPKRLIDKKDPDYWEPTKRVASDQMSPLPETGYDDQLSGDRSRWNQIEKNVVYLDFRSELSAFDKFMHHQPFNRWAKTRAQQRFRMIQLSNRVAAALEGRPLARDLSKIQQISCELAQEEVAAVSLILGKKISKITLLQHSIFGPPGYTFRLHLSEADLSYSEAHAGSGEYAAVRLVHDIFTAPQRSLILLDEPEVSLHPGAQKKLLDFVMEMSLKKGHQVVISTHSPTIAASLPDHAIKVLGFDPSSNNVSLIQDGCSPRQAFAHLGQIVEGDSRFQIIVEDELAAEIVRYALRAHSPLALKAIHVHPFPGGADSMVQRLLPALALARSESSALLLDGDKRPPMADARSSASEFLQHSSGQSQTELKAQWKAEISETAPYVFPNSHDGEPVPESEKGNLIQCFTWAIDHLGYLPGDTPEQLLAEAAGLPFPAGTGAKGLWISLTRKSLGLSSEESVSSDDVLLTQRQHLARLERDSELFCQIRSEIERLQQSSR